VGPLSALVPALSQRLRLEASSGVGLPPALEQPSWGVLHQVASLETAGAVLVPTLSQILHHTALSGEPPLVRARLALVGLPQWASLGVVLRVPGRVLLGLLHRAALVAHRLVVYSAVVLA